jgi:integrase
MGGEDTIQERHLSWSRVIQIVSALRFFYRVTLQQPWMIEFIPHPKRPQTLPTLLSPAEVATLLQAPRELTSRAILTTLYAAGLRVSELCHLHVTDIDSARMVLRIRQGKGQKDRYVMLAPQLLSLSCGSIGGRPSPACGSFQGPILRSPSGAKLFTSSVGGRGCVPTWGRPCIRICSDTPLPVICSMLGSTCAGSNCS